MFTMNKLRSAVVATLVSGFTVSAAYADETTNGITFTPMLGYTSYDFNEIKVENDKHYGLAVGYQTSGALAFELAYQTADTTLNGFDGSVEQYRVDMLVDLIQDASVKPYFVFGGGQQQFGADDSAKEKNDFIDSGLGLKFVLNNHAAIRTDVRANYDLNEDHQSYSANLGLQITIGSSSKKAPKVVVAVDTDKDGVNDDADQCPNTAVGTMVDAMGCEKIMDADKDGVVDANDACPNSAAGVPVNEKGCTATISEDISADLLVTFANNSSDITSGEESLPDVAKIMNDHSAVTVVIEGHSDSSGSADYNQKLSQKRAQSVVDTLVNKYGISASRLSAIGYGEANPIATNETAEGRAKNRRVTAVAKATVTKAAE